MRYNELILVLKYSLKRNKVHTIVSVLFTIAGLVIGSCAGVVAYYNSWLG